MIRVLCTAAVLLAATLSGLADAADGFSREQRATCRLSQKIPNGPPGAGSYASGTIIRYNGHLFILSTGHQYAGATAEQRYTLDIKITILQPDGTHRHFKGWLYCVDHGHDLSIVRFWDNPGDVPYCELGDFSESVQAYHFGWNGTERQMLRSSSFIGYCASPSGSKGFVLNKPSIPGDSGSGVFQNGKVVGVVQATDTIDRTATVGKSFCAHSESIGVFLGWAQLGARPAPPAAPAAPAAPPPARRPQPFARPFDAAPQGHCPPGG